ncbi:MAG: hypothetical protein IKO27_01610 [Ruminococcus sp.]|nr:hypothetical protein [Ruminococcus sp.]
MGNNDCKGIPVNNIPLIYFAANGYKEQMMDAAKTMMHEAGNYSEVDRASVCATMGFFACELYMKYIIAYLNITDGKKRVTIPFTHDLSKLFEKLGNELETSIFESMAGNNDYSREEFNNELKKCSDGFVLCRYYFEQDPEKLEKDDLSENKKITIKYDFLKALTLALGKKAAEYSNSFKISFDSDKCSSIIIEDIG